ncbi:MAG: glycosyltransferase family 4 protein [Anaerolineae bacterium]|nr:glycosyltransferase family 4 protein [Anaerolineae bacterium]
MNIVMIGPFAFAPKATVSARTFPMAQALVRRGHRVTLLLPPYDNLQDAGQSWEREGVQIHNLPIRRVTAVTPMVAAVRLAALTRWLRPDVVHIFKPVGYAALAGMILRHTSRLPLVTDTDDWEGTGGWNSVNPYPWHWRRFFDLQERWLPRHSSAVTVASRTLETQVWGMGVPPRQVIYVPNCPGPTFLSRRTQVSESDKGHVRSALGIGGAPLAIYVGHIVRGNDLDLALAAMKRVLVQIPTARLAIVGAGDGLAPLRSLVADEGLDGTVLFTGWVEHHLVPAYLAAADVAIYPYRDSLINRAKCSIKILEYMAMGQAIVTHRVGQNVEYLEHEQSGILADPGDVEGFAEGLIAVLSDPGLAARLGRNARERIERRFNWEQRIEDVERAYGIACADEQGCPTNHQGTRPTLDCLSSNDRTGRTLLPAAPGGASAVSSLPLEGCGSPCAGCTAGMRSSGSPTRGCPPAPWARRDRASSTSQTARSTGSGSRRVERSRAC